MNQFDGFQLGVKRTLSDTLINTSIRKENANNSNEFIKIDSNYTEALEEVFKKKKKYFSLK